MELKFSVGNIKEVATRFWKIAGHARVVAFHGEMGSGKTTFIHALCEVKKVQGTVSSPTFSLINEYSYSEDNVEKKIFHIDLYRLKDEDEALTAGMEDCLYSDHICLVEWPEKAPGIFPPGTLHIYIEITDSANRKLQIDDKIS